MITCAVYIALEGRGLYYDSTQQLADTADNFTKEQNQTTQVMPKVRRSKKRPPEGWELIEPTLDELDQKMREGKFITCCVV